VLRPRLCLDQSPSWAASRPESELTDVTRFVVEGVGQDLGVVGELVDDYECAGRLLRTPDP
jgi:hypothetical protein